ncbi:MAG: protein-L-isoaspartate(D-aspartate) O-methyltransferase [Candidatus Zixiibacteriota bacterium]|nr:MAG: protein-L-isoaspartate(D-aspartate) O-methyltransferase [candidate division Zixibacteria bacterium]
MDIFLAVLMLFSKPPQEPDYHKMRAKMVEYQIMTRGIKDSRVIGAMMKVPRHRFVPEDKRFRAYDDGPLPIGEGQTISQPYIVALMTELLEPQEGDRILEIGTGSGYQAAVLAEIVDTVYSIEIICELQERADSTLKSLGYNNVITKCGDGYDGWPEAAPFDGVIVTAAPEKVPQPLLDQLKEGAKLVIPVGAYMQYLEVYTRVGDKFKRERNVPVRFVPMTGKAEDDDQD